MKLRCIETGEEGDLFEVIDEVIYVTLEDGTKLVALSEDLEVVNED